MVVGGMAVELTMGAFRRLLVVQTDQVFTHTIHMMIVLRWYKTCRCLVSTSWRRAALLRLTVCC